MPDDGPLLDGFQAYDLTHKPRTLEAVAFAAVKPILAGRSLIKGVLYQEQESLILGPKQSGKTFFAINMDLHGPK
jgi:hypothetical protein